MDILEVIREELIKAGHHCADITQYGDDVAFNLRDDHAAPTALGRLTLHDQIINVDVWWPNHTLAHVVNIDLTEPNSIPRLIRHLEPLRPR